MPGKIFALTYHRGVPLVRRGPSLAEIKAEVYGIVVDDSAGAALRRVAYLFFYTELAERSVQTKRTFLRRVWDHIERRMEMNANNDIEEAIDLAEMGIDAEWVDGNASAPVEALAQVREDLLEGWKQAVVLGRASALVDLICRGECELSEHVLLGLAKRLS